MTTKISAGKARPSGPLCIYDERGDAIALISERRGDAEQVALAIVEAVNNAGGLAIQPAKKLS